MATGELRASGRPGRGESSSRSSTVDRVLDILEAVVTAEHPPSPTDIAERLGIPKASAHRLCVSLEEGGFVETRLSGRGLQPGRRLRRVALAVLSSIPRRTERRAILERLSEEIGETCNIAVPDGTEMIYFERAETHWPIRVQFQSGSRVPVMATASGKMYLSTLPRERRRSLIHNTHREALTPNTILDTVQLERELDETRHRGYATDNEEYLEGMVALAVPLQDAEGRLFATLSFHAPSMRVPFARVTEFLPRLRLAADELMALSID